MKKYYVYVHTNKVNGKRYVGLTTMKPEERWHGGCGYKTCKLFNKAIKKYGWDAFEHQVIELDNKDQMEDLEMLLIDYFDTTNPDKGYNITSGGEHFKHSEESKQKMRDAKKGKYCGENHPMYGKHHSEETRKKLSDSHKGKFVGEDNPRYGKHCSDDTKKKIREAVSGEKHPLFGKHHTAETLKRMSVAVCQYSLDGEFIKEWQSASVVQAELGISGANICHCCKGRQKSCKGFVWKYKD